MAQLWQFLLLLTSRMREGYQDQTCMNFLVVGANLYRRQKVFVTRKESVFGRTTVWPSFILKVSEMSSESLATYIWDTLCRHFLEIIQDEILANGPLNISLLFQHEKTVTSTKTARFQGYTWQRRNHFLFRNLRYQIFNSTFVTTERYTFLNVWVGNFEDIHVERLKRSTPYKPRPLRARVIYRWNRSPLKLP